MKRGKKHMKKRKYGVLDKIITGFAFLCTSVLFVVDKVKHFIPDEHSDLRILIIFVGALAAFYQVLLFVWDKKFDNIRSSILGENNENEENTIKDMKDKMSDLSNKISDLINYNTAVLKNRTLFTDTSLSEIENNLKKYLNQKSDNEYIIIYIITNANNVEAENFAHVIRKNILCDYQYFYMTNLKDDQFHKGLKKRVFENDEQNRLLNAAYKKNIHHVSNPSFFECRPGYSDIVIYAKYQHVKRTSVQGDCQGYYCYQNDAITDIIGIEHIPHYYYYKMTSENVKEIMELFSKFKIWNSVEKSLLSEKIEIKDSAVNGKGLFVKKGQSINQDEHVFTKGGYFKQSCENGNYTHLRIDENNYLCGTDIETDSAFFFPNHRCRANCKLQDEITFVANEKINSEEEIFVNYAIIDDKDNVKFLCNNSKCEDSKRCKKEFKKSVYNKNNKENSLPFMDNTKKGVLK